MRPMADLRLPGRRPPVVGMAVGAFVASVGILHGHHSGRALDPLAVVLTAIAASALLWARHWPLRVFALSTLMAAVLSAIGYHVGVPIPAGFALWTVAANPRTRHQLPLTAAVVLGMLAVYVIATVAGPNGLAGGSILGTCAMFGGAWIAGEQMRQRRQRIVDARETAERTRREHEREQRLAVAEERNRIARDLHDSAAHAINVILVQAGAARLLQDRDPGAVRTALSTIEDVARETIGEIEGIIRGLRERGDGVEPPIGLDALPTLIDRHRANGLAAEVAIEGEPRALASGLDQAAYRILQESLTNAARYGDGRAEVRIDYRTERLELAVVNRISGMAAAARGGGHGILGMRERAELLGGSLAAETRDGRFIVNATLPY